ncbi:hypothetical protein GLOIN_2v1684140 [Rhizophagus irregularis DAOM 181602=DAOM 197198]|uniref:Uncharacterized protein n=1 Tax=Rhizophagus irregularis (strain DAOM 181602 / DAOM 197198 / MUCL 43194) TaxID=747089 RepID=A0A2P4PE68_RHIID|nr:hypothetical protein GLOIN_2v1684140 [Rhizophagus irregularis DAOM 181602=DAOM 197198]POG63675.1 hypothetical protein GLOIN_2v1684140 [Rhizophagus irregularis DAOM 181602=DAOM 197198]|eukprot:XP_025170541.1 hypothetical protein GLOIN_2v1684140 [Rhizophagus irregularis DAOM 181602=DAOM 197198]
MVLISKIIKKFMESVYYLSSIMVIYIIKFFFYMKNDLHWKLLIQVFALTGKQNKKVFHIYI